MPHMFFLFVFFWRKNPGFSGSFLVKYINPLSQIPTQYPNRVNTPPDSAHAVHPVCTLIITSYIHIRQNGMLHLFSLETACLVTGISTVCCR